ncbi:MAG TPA: hypothetical protein VKS60_15580 [Stellaceae bacterium]|nr:hypothetical protein [Stellaceae bacterium]
MADDALDLFLRGETDGRTFRHLDHLRMGFELLRRASFTQAAAAFSASLKIIAARNGTPGAYHETMTVAFLALIAEHAACGAYTDFEEFIAANPALADKRILQRWYGAERLGSALARKTFILPERQGGPT